MCARWPARPTLALPGSGIHGTGNNAGAITGTATQQKLTQDTPLSISTVISVGPTPDNGRAEAVSAAGDSSGSRPRTTSARWRRRSPLGLSATRGSLHTEIDASSLVDASVAGVSVVSTSSIARTRLLAASTSTVGEATAAAQASRQRAACETGSAAAVFSLCVSDVRAFCTTAQLSPRVVPALCALLTSMAGRATNAANDSSSSGNTATTVGSDGQPAGGKLQRTGSAPLSRQLTAVAADPALMSETLGLDQKAQERFHAALLAPTSTGARRVSRLASAAWPRRPVLGDLSNVTISEAKHSKKTAGDGGKTTSASALEWAKKWAPNAPVPNMSECG